MRIDKQASGAYVPKILERPSAEHQQNPRWPFTGHIDFDRLMFQAAAIGTAALGTGAVVGLVSLAKNYRNQRKHLENLNKAVQGTMPEFSPDPNLDDIETEERERAAGLPKAANDPEAHYTSKLSPGSVMQLLNPIGVMSVQGPDDPTAYLQAIVPLAAAIAGGSIGYAGVQRLYNKHYGSKLQKDIGQLRNELDKETYDKLMRARMPAAKEANDRNIWEQSKDWLADNFASEPAGNRRMSASQIKSLVALAALGVVGGSAVATKRYMDSRDPARTEYKRVQTALRELRNREVEDRPIKIAPVNPALQAALDAHLVAPQRRQVPAPRLLQEAPATMRPEDILKDETDPAMAALV